MTPVSGRSKDKHSRQIGILCTCQLLSFSLSLAPLLCHTAHSGSDLMALPDGGSWGPAEYMLGQLGGGQLHSSRRIRTLTQVWRSAGLRVGSQAEGKVSRDTGRRKYKSQSPGNYSALFASLAGGSSRSPGVALLPGVTLQNLEWFVPTRFCSQGQQLSFLHRENFRFQLKGQPEIRAIMLGMGSCPLSKFSEGAKGRSFHSASEYTSAHFFISIRTHGSWHDYIILVEQTCSAQYKLLPILGQGGR